MIKIHEMILPFKTWLLVTVVAFLVCLGFAVFEAEQNARQEVEAAVEELRE